MKKSKAIITLVVILACLALVGWFAVLVVRDTDTDMTKRGKNHIGLGLDLSGGVSITYEIVNDDYTEQDVEDTKAKMEDRAASTGTTEYSVYKNGDNRITVEIPGVDNPNEVLKKLGAPGALYFITEKDSEGNSNFVFDQTVGDYVLAEGVTIESLQANGSIVLDGNSVKEANATYEQENQNSAKKPVCSLVFNDDAADTWYNVTKAAHDNGTKIGIYYDGKFISCPGVTESDGIAGGSCVINGMASFEEADELATFIRIGAIKLELRELESSVVGAQLGTEALATSLKAGIIGLIIVAIFMIVMYGISGVAADIALACYTVIVIAFIQLFEITLTLPGIAGIILGIGMAVDANVITFARIREEIASGKTVGAAIKEGYKKAFSAILDGNVTTFIAALVLLLLGSGTVRGFAYTLMISIVASMFTALVVARLVMYALYALGCKSEKLYGRAKERKGINFIKNRVIYFVISLVIIVAGIVGMAVFSAKGDGMLNFGLEFKGGNSTSVVMDKAYTVEELEASVVPEIAKITGDSNIQATTVDDGNAVVFKTGDLTAEEQSDIADMLESKFNVDKTTIESQNISSTISNEMRKDAILAVVVACIFMLLYIWFRFKDLRFASSAIIALVHDVLIVLTAYALIRISVGNTFIACMLTIVGYSVNDTIVIFDRIRENMKGHSHLNREALAEIANKSLTQTLSRSINTSITTIIMVLMLFIFGVSSIKAFALPLLVGMICGSYSSIFIATELWYVMKCKLGKNRIKA